MATAFGPEGASPIPIMAEPQGHFALPDDSTSSNLQSSPRSDAPPPNPAFTFPMRPDSPSSAPPSFSRASGRRPASAIESQDASLDLPSGGSEKTRRSVALPVFSFNPGASLPPDPSSPMLLSPPVTPNSPRTGPSQQRPAGSGHRRGGSEFVGGRLREGNSIAVMGTSPTKSESGFASPSFQPPRKGHRRGVSSAISTNDLPLLPPPVNPIGNKGSSAPTSPTNFEQQDYMSLDQEVPPPPEPIPVAEQKTIEAAPVENVEEAAAEDSPKQPKSGTRARVGFSDTLEYIPRPVSMVSSDASSTATTRPGHSTNESLSSVMSTSSPGRDSPVPLSRSPTRDMGDSRPSTAGAILEGIRDPSAATAPDASPRRRNSIPALLDMADAAALTPPTPSPTKTKRWTFFGLEPFASSGSPTKARPCSSSSSDSTPRAVSAGSSSEQGSDSPSEPAAAPKHKKAGKKGKKKKVKGWAGVILPRKQKGQSKRSKTSGVRPPTPPPAMVPPEDDDDEPEVAETQAPEVATPPTVTITESATPPKPAGSAQRSMDDASYPMIDLDAALGPFNTPLPNNPEWDAAQRAGSVGKRRLHSAQMMKGFSGPGMHYHRRAESAPDLPPFDPGRSSLHRFGSSSTMDDVFEEEEEEEQGDSETKSEAVEKSEQSDETDGETTPPAGPTKNVSLAEAQDAVPHMVRRKSSGLSDKDQAGAQSVRTERSRTSLQEDVIAEELPSVVFRTTNMFQSGEKDASEPATSPKKNPNAKDAVSPVDLNTIHIPGPAAMPTSPYSMSHASSHPSPRSPMSVDAQRISTAPSSVTDENSFHSLLMGGEPGPEVRISVDYDIPSLTSSTSTMTRESSFIHNPRLSQPTLREQRPVSVSSAAFSRRRSSLVSLSRLISSSHGERSKLSMEVRLDNEPDSKKPKNSKTKRLGRMMQFWKPTKDGAPP